MENKTGADIYEGRRKTNTLPDAIAGEDEADMNAEEDSDESSASESASENEAVQSHLMQEGNEVVAVREDLHHGMMMRGQKTWTREQQGNAH